jgi:ankyrin repeat protein
MISVMDVNRFYIGNDGTETCALHTAAFNGADNVVEFLCAGIDLRDSRLDGGLCDVNAKDINGWTALHFAAGANSVAAVRVLAHHGAILNVEAHNGYAPLAWSVRLSNEGVAEELRELMSRLGTDQSGTWMYSKPLASIANHLFSLIPSH